MTETLAFSLNGFLKAHNLSKSAFYSLPASQRPRQIRLGRKVLISAESAAEWRRKMEEMTADGIGGA